MTKLRDEVIQEQWDESDIPDYFPRLRTEGAALYAQLPEEVINAGCLLLMRDHYRNALRTHGEPQDKVTLHRGRGAPPKPVVALFRAANLTVLQARKAAATLTACMYFDDVKRADAETAEREHTRMLIDYLLAARHLLRAEGVPRPDERDMEEAVIYLWKHQYPKPPAQGTWPAMSVWDEIEQRDLDALDISMSLLEPRISSPT